MSTVKKTILIILSIIIVCIGGINIKQHIENKEIEEVILKRELPRVEKYIKYNFKNIEKFTLESFEKNPMGSYFLDGYINDDTELFFSAIVGDKFEGDTAYSPKLIPKKKDSNGVEILKDIEDIEEEEKNKE